MNICIVSPHLDDALLSCGILMQRHAAQGDSVYVLNIFSAGTNAANRHDEDRRAQAEIGVLPFFLEELDAPDRDPVYNDTLQLFQSKPRPQDAALLDRLEARVKEFFAETKPSLALFPLAAGTHIDHQLAYETGRRIKDIPVRFYEDRPYILWPGILQGRMNMIGADAGLPAVTPEDMKNDLDNYHYLKHFVPEGVYRDKSLPLYTGALAKTPVRVKATPQSLTATEEELKQLYEALAQYDSQMPYIYNSYDNFIADSLKYQRRMTGEGLYIERSWTLDDMK